MQECSGSWLLHLVSILLEFGVHNLECGQEVAKEEDEEGERQHKHLPFSAFLMAGEFKQCDGIVELPEMATEQEREEECETSPHPGLESFHREVQMIPLPQCPQPVEAAPLVIVL